MLNFEIFQYEPNKSATPDFLHTLILVPRQLS